mmetsp:Transcript_46579/g.72559  ORF Transcript_46579/g.72559 Transcript_46579/m.72559 type:complete len:887 (+) Transcript_46579:53-2713(+)
MAPKKRNSSASAEVAQEIAPSKHTEASITAVLNVGDARYTCLCTRDPQAADDWASSIMKSGCMSEPGSAPATVVSLDCEWAAPWHRGPNVPDRLATLQISHCGPDGMRVLVFAVAALNGTLPPAVVSLLGDARVAKVGANLAGDATRVIRDFGCPVRGVYDLCRLNRKPGAKIRKSISLEAVVKANCPQEMHVSKAGADVRTSNWENWPLSEEQVLYASRDAALGLLAFMFKFDMSPAGSAGLTKAAADALVDLDSVTEPADTQKGSAEDVDNAEKKDHSNFFQHMRNSNVKPPNLGKKEHPKGAADALAKVCIVVSGTLDSFERSDMEKYVLEHGGKVSKSVTKNVTHLVTDHGEAGPSKLKKCKEFGIPVVSEDVILRMVGGESFSPIINKESPEVTKTVDEKVGESATSSVSVKSDTKKRVRQSKPRIVASVEVADKGDQVAMESSPPETTETCDPVALETQSPVGAKSVTKKRPSKEQSAVDESAILLEATDATHVDNEVAIATSTSVSAKGAGKKRGRQSKQSSLVEESSSNTGGSEIAKTGEPAGAESTSVAGATGDKKKPVRKSKQNSGVASATKDSAAEEPATKKADNKEAEVTKANSSENAKTDATKKRGRASKHHVVAEESSTNEGKPNETEVTEPTSSDNAKSDTSKKRRRQSKQQKVGEDSVTNTEEKDAAKTTDMAIDEKSSSVVAKSESKKRGRASKSQTVVDDVPTSDQSKDAKPDDSVKPKANTAIATPVRKRITKSAKDLAVSKEKATAIQKPRIPNEIAKPASTASVKEGPAETTPEKNVKGDEETPAKKARKTAQPSVVAGVDVDSETMNKAKDLSLGSELMNLAGRKELRGQGFSAASLLAALKKSQGLVNSAKHLLLSKSVISEN